MLVAGFLDGDLRQWTLKLRGHDLTGVAGGKNLADEERRFFSVWGLGFTRPGLPGTTHKE